MFCRILDAGHAIVHDPACVIHHMNTREGDAYAELHRDTASASARSRTSSCGSGSPPASHCWRSSSSGPWDGPCATCATRGGEAPTVRCSAASDRASSPAPRMRISGTTFIDEHPPAPTPIDEQVDRDTGRRLMERPEAKAELIRTLDEKYVANSIAFEAMIAAAALILDGATLRRT